MKPIPTADAIRLGMLIEYLRGISSVSISTTAVLDDLPELNANFAGNRYRVLDVAAVVREVIETLEKFELEETLAVIGDLGEKLQEMEGFLNETSDPEGAFLLNPFANDIVAFANAIGDAVITEVAE